MENALKRVMSTSLLKFWLDLSIQTKVRERLGKLRGMFEGEPELFKKLQGTKESEILRSVLKTKRRRVMRDELEEPGRIQLNDSVVSAILWISAIGIGISLVCFIQEVLRKFLCRVGRV